MKSAVIPVVRSLKEISSLSSSPAAPVRIAALLLSKSDDLICNNLFCEKVTLPCICRLERSLAKVSTLDLKKLDLSSNRLTDLPPSLEKFTELEELDISNNALSKIPAYFAKFKHLKHLIRDWYNENCVKKSNLDNCINFHTRVKVQHIWWRLLVLSLNCRIGNVFWQKYYEIRWHLVLKFGVRVLLFFGILPIEHTNKVDIRSKILYSLLVKAANMNYY